jgi:hypothetical protein
MQPEFMLVVLRENVEKAVEKYANGVGFLCDNNQNRKFTEGKSRGVYRQFPKARFLS